MPDHCRIVLGPRAPFLIVLVVLGALMACPWPMPAQAQRAPAPKPGMTGGSTGNNNTRLAADLHLNQGMTYAAMRDWENAVTEFSKAVDIDRGYAAAYT